MVKFTLDEVINLWKTVLVDWRKMFIQCSNKIGLKKLSSSLGFPGLWIGFILQTFQMLGISSIFSDMFNRFVRSLVGFSPICLPVWSNGIRFSKFYNNIYLVCRERVFIPLLKFVDRSENLSFQLILVCIRTLAMICGRLTPSASL